MSSFFAIWKNYTTIFLILAILILGLFLRYDNFRTIPRHGATFDEFAWTWLGINLIQKQIPISWSSQPQYENKFHLRYQGAAFWIVRPYLEHPPLFGLVAGSSALLSGAKDMYTVNLSNMRPLSLILGGISILMVFLLSKEIFGREVALLSSILYATVPTIAIGSRILQNENFLIPAWLFSIYLTLKYLKSGRKRFRNTAAVIAGLISLAKVPWLVVGLSLSMILSYKNKWRDAFIVGIITVLVFTLFIIYGFYFDKELFLNLWRLQIARYDITFSGFFSIFKDPLLVDRFYLDGWIFFGWLSVIFLLKDIRKNFPITIPFIAYLITYIFGIPNEPSHGWYRYPFYPFLIISTAFVLREELRKVSVISIVFVLIVGLALLQNTWANFFGFSYFVYRFFILLSVLPFIYLIWRKKNNPKIVIFWLILFTILNIASVLSYAE